MDIPLYDLAKDLYNHQVGTTCAVSGPWSRGEAVDDAVSAETRLSADEVAEHTVRQVRPGIWINGWATCEDGKFHGLIGIRDTTFNPALVGRILTKTAAAFCHVVTQETGKRFIPIVTHTNHAFVNFTVYHAPFTLAPMP